MKNIQQEVISGNVNPYDLLDLWNEKPLSQADIESLGFKIHDYDDMDSFTNGDIDIELNQYINEFIVEVWTRKNMLDRSAEIVFKGTIKNKSELKKVLKMIGYE